MIKKIFDKDSVGHELRPTTHSHQQSEVNGLQVALAGKADVVHDHDERYYTEAEVDTKLAGKAEVNHNHSGVYAGVVHTHTMDKITGLAGALSGKASLSHDHDEIYYEKEEVDNLIAGRAHKDHNHDDRYYTEMEVDHKLEGKADYDHNHDFRYYTEAEVDAKLATKASTAALAGKVGIEYCTVNEYQGEILLDESKVFVIDAEGEQKTLRNILKAPTGKTVLLDESSDIVFDEQVMLMVVVAGDYVYVSVIGKWS